MKPFNFLYHISRGLILLCFVLFSLSVSAKTTGTVKGNVTVTAKQHPYMPVKSNLAEVMVTAKRHPYMPVKSNLAEVVVTAKRPVMIQTAGLFNFSPESYINTTLLNVNVHMKELQVISIVCTGNFSVTAIPTVITLLK